MVHGLHSESILASKVINIVSRREIKIPVSFIASGIVEASCCCPYIRESYFVFSNLSIDLPIKRVFTESSKRNLKKTSLLKKLKYDMWEK